MAVMRYVTFGRKYQDQCHERMPHVNPDGWLEFVVDAGHQVGDGWVLCHVVFGGDVGRCGFPCWVFWPVGF